MNLEKLVAVSGLPGLYRIAANRNNGLIVEDLSTGKRRFASSRKHQFTPLESIAVFTDDGESTELKNVFSSMFEKREEYPPVNPAASPEELHAYLAVVLPNYDRERVFTGDIRKMIKWFTYLHENGALEASPVEENNEELPPAEEEE